MGFFSSRKADDDNSHISTSSNVDKSVVQVIRSRFYGKHKGKEREEPEASFQLHPSSANALSHPIRIQTPKRIPTTSTSITNPTTHSHNDRSGPNTPSRSKLPPSGSSSIMPQPPSSHSLVTEMSPPKPRPVKNTASPLQPRHTDTITMTLAQRLNELGTANSEGLLNDDEYRLLRQSLFERFASSTTFPTEVPVVPVARHPRAISDNFEGRPSLASSRPSSQFLADVSRSPSIRSKTSVTSGMTSLLRRATGRRIHSVSKDPTDTSSIFSATSTTSNVFKLPRALSRKSSKSSIQTEISRAPTDTMSISSRRTDRNTSDHSSHFSPSVSRSIASQSIRRMATPPSSFPARAVGTEPRYTNPVGINDILDEESLKTSQQIREEILIVEAEGKRLMDAFNGLELTTLTRRQRKEGRLPPVTTTMEGREWRDGIESTWTLIPEGKSQQRGLDSDTTSVRSATSAGTAPSMTRSAYSSRKARPPKPGTLSTSRPGSLHRKNSVSSVSSQGKSTKGVPPVPPFPLNLGSLGVVASGSSINLSRSTGHLPLPLSALPETEIKESSDTAGVDDEDVDFEKEMADIRRRREEVSARYGGRLDYLRAKLKGAQLHEKLLKN